MKNTLQSDDKPMSYSGPNLSKAALAAYNHAIMAISSISDHTSAKFEEAMSGLRGMAMNMGGVVEERVRFAANVLRTRDFEQAKLVAISDYQVNRLELQVNEMCTNILALRNPLARDLRMVLVTLKAVTDLERVGDEAERISKQVIDMGQAEIPAAIQQELNDIGQHTSDMLHHALDSFARINPDAHSELQDQDRIVDSKCNGVISEFKVAVSEGAGDIQLLLNALWCARSFERIGDHAKNIAEYVVYLAEGKDIRHSTHTSADASPT